MMGVRSVRIRSWRDYWTEDVSGGQRWQADPYFQGTAEFLAERAQAPAAWVQEQALAGVLPLNRDADLEWTRYAIEEGVSTIAPAEIAGDVYVATADGTSLVKIGYSIKVATRLCNLRASSPLPIFLMGTCDGGRWRERALHERWRHFRHHGEWFDPSSDMLKELRKLLAGPDLAALWERPDLARNVA